MPARPPISSGTSKLSTVITNSNNSAAPTAGMTSGKEIRRSVRHGPAPVIAEASSSRGSMARNDAASSR